MNSYRNLSIVIPTINEKENLQILLFQLKDLYPGAHLIVSDDGSTDGTYDFIESIIKSDFSSPVSLLSRDRNKLLTNDRNINSDLFYNNSLGIRNTPGLTAAVLDALSLITTEKFAVIDADFQHPPEIIQKMYDRLHNADLACAYRTKLEGFPFYRKLLTKTGIFLANSVLPKHSRVKDPLSGAFAGNIKKLKPSFLNIDNFKLKGFKILFDLLKTITPHINLDEIGYEFKMRIRGKSKIGWKQLLSFLKSIFDNKAKKFFAGCLLPFSFILIGSILIFAFGDIKITQYIRDWALGNPRILDSARFITDYGNYLYYFLFIIFIIYGAVKNKKKYLKIGLIYLGAQIIASIIITGGLKIAIGRPRPGKGFAHHFFTSSSRFKSFPSGHTTDAFCSAGVLWGFLTSYFMSFLFFFYSFLIGLTRILVGSHYFLDVIAGMAVGFLTGIIITYKKL